MRTTAPYPTLSPEALAPRQVAMLLVDGLEPALHAHDLERAPTVIATPDGGPLETLFALALWAGGWGERVARDTVALVFPRPTLAEQHQAALHCAELLRRALPQLGLLLVAGPAPEGSGFPESATVRSGLALLAQRRA